MFADVVFGILLGASFGLWVAFDTLFTEEQRSMTYVETIYTFTLALVAVSMTYFIVRGATAVYKSGTPNNESRVKNKKRELELTRLERDIRVTKNDNRPRNRGRRKQNTRNRNENLWRYF